MSPTRDLKTSPGPSGESGVPPVGTSDGGAGGNGGGPNFDSERPKGGPSNSILGGTVTILILGGLIYAVVSGGSSGPASTFPASTFIADGPFTYQFEQGEVLRYQLDARATGTGFEMGTESDIGLTMHMTFDLETLEARRDGSGTLELEFDEVRMTGNFMGDPVSLYQSGGETEMDLNRGDQIDTRQGDSIEGIPQLEFFEQPIRMEIGPDGHVTDIEGAPGFDLILSPSKALAPSRFTTSHLEIGESWTSEFNLPVPGLAIPASATAHNTLVEYTTIGDRNCGVIRQQMDATQLDGSLLSPSSALSEQMGFSMPTFEVSGVNMIYFDVDDGKLVRTEMNLTFHLEIGDQLDSIKGALGAYSQVLGELEGSGASADPILNLGVKIDATLVLVE